MPALAVAISSAASYAISAAVGLSAFSWTVLGKWFLAGLILGAVYQILGPKRPGPPGYRETMREVQIRAVARRRTVLGTVRVGGVIMHIEVTGTGKQKTIHIAQAVSDGACHSIGDVFVDGTLITKTRDSSGVHRGTGDYANHFILYEYLDADGTQGTAFHTATTATSAFQANGLSWFYCALTQNNYTDANDRLYTSTLPRIEVVLSGRKLTWPGQSTPTYTANAAAIHYWRLVERKKVDPANIDRASFDSAYAICNATVTTPLPSGPGYSTYSSTALTYEINTSVFADEEEQGVIEAFNTAIQGYTFQMNGTWYIRPGANRVPVDHIGPEDIVETGDFQAAPELQGRCNQASFSLPQSEAHSYLEYTLPVYRDTNAVASDGGDYPLDFGDLRCVNDPISARRLLKIQLARLRAAKTWSYVIYPGELFERARRIKPTDVITVTDPELGLENERMEVTQTVLNPPPEFSMGISLRSAPAALYEHVGEVPPAIPQ